MTAPLGWNGQTNAEFLEDVFSGHQKSNSTFETCEHFVVGGGLSGILLALRLSSKPNSQVALIESEASLGGRIFFSPPWQVRGNPMERAASLLEVGLFGRKLSGPGFEAFESGALQALERHLLQGMTEEERSFVELFCLKNTGGKPLLRVPYVVRKEITPIQEMRAGSSELFTKKEAEALNSLLSGLEEHERSSVPLSGEEGSEESSEKSSEKSSERSSEKEVALEGFRPWKDVPKSSALSGFLETICGFGFEKSPVSRIRSLLLDAFKRDQNHANSEFRRDSGLEFALEFVLRKRGVEILTQSRVVRMEHEKKQAHKLWVAGTDWSGFREISAKQVHLCAPLARSIQILGRDQWNAGQSKLLAKFRPRSLVTLEIQQGQEILKKSASGETFDGGSYFFCPIEKTFAQVSSLGHVQISTWMDYEDSLQAPPVRESVTRLRKSALRLLSPEGYEEVFSKQNLYVAKQASERVVLLPVGWGSPHDVVNPDLCTDVKSRLGGVSVCGDGFTFHADPWRNIVASVQQAASSVALRESGKLEKSASV